VDVRLLATNEPLFSLNPRRFLLPASNQKLLTTAVAAERLGWDFRFVTRVVSTGTVAPDGTLTGDLIVIGTGDPSINPRHPERWHVFDDWAATLQTLGIRSIGGHIIGDDNAIEEPGLGEGWSWDNLQYGYGTAVGALQYNENQVELIIAPGLEAGKPAAISSSPAGHGLLIHNLVATAEAGATSDLDIARLPASNVIEIRGRIAADAKPTTITASVENPTLFYLHALKDALERHGIAVTSSAIDVDDLRSPLDLTHPTELIVDRSPPLSEIIDVCLKWSRNEYAETLLRALAPPDHPASAPGGLDAIRSQLDAWGIAPELYLARDGSGLSRQDYVSAEAFTRLLSHIANDAKLFDPFRSALPVAGVSGTLADRMKATAAENHVWAKTGTLLNVRTLSGYAITNGGETVVFSMLANNFRVPATEIDAAMDKALARIVEFKR